MLTTPSVAALALAVALALPAARAQAPLINTTAVSPTNASTTLAGADTTERIAPSEGIWVCSALVTDDWSQYKYACSWSHAGYRNFFFKRYDGTYFYECDCRNRIDLYRNWAGWAYTRADRVECFSRDQRWGNEIAHEFDSVSCKDRQVYCDTRTGACVTRRN